jgi:hypothetical protein
MPSKGKGPISSLPRESTVAEVGRAQRLTQVGGEVIGGEPCRNASPPQTAGPDSPCAFTGTDSQTRATIAFSVISDVAGVFVDHLCCQSQLTARTNSRRNPLICKDFFYLIIQNELAGVIGVSVLRATIEISPHAISLAERS